MVISDMLFNTNDEESTQTYKWELLIFKLFEDANKNWVEFSREQYLKHEVYKVEIIFL